jgi:hypothetical protein
LINNVVRGGVVTDSAEYHTRDRAPDQQPPKLYDDPWRNATNYTAQWLEQVKPPKDCRELIAAMRADAHIPHLFADGMLDYIKFKGWKVEDGCVIAWVWNDYCAWVRETLGWERFGGTTGRNWLRVQRRRWPPY